VPPATGTPGSGPSVRRVAVLRALQLGDLLCAVPALRALRAGLPTAEITLVGLGGAREFAGRFHRYLDAFLELPGFPGLPEVEPRVHEIPGFLARAQEARFDLAVQLHGSGSVTNPLTVLLGARRNAGFYQPGRFCPDEDLFVPYPNEGHEIRRLLRLPERLGMPLQGEELEFPIRDEDRDDLRRAAPDLSQGDYACVHPGARFESRRWPVERFAAVADALAERGVSVVLTGSPAEAGLTARVAAAARAPVLDLGGRTSLGALAALLDGARMLLSNDTGVAHLAAALRLPSVVVVTTSDPGRWAPLDRDLHRVVLRPDDPEAVVAVADRQLRRARPVAA
jgi:ADP-heptose:LPS heptosyltransferase